MSTELQQALLGAFATTMVIYGVFIAIYCGGHGVAGLIRSWGARREIEQQRVNTFLRSSWL